MKPALTLEQLALCGGIYIYIHVCLAYESRFAKTYDKALGCDI